MQTDTTINGLTEKEIKTLFRTDIGHFAEAALHAHAMVYLSHLVLVKRPDREKEHLIQLIKTHNKNTEVESKIMTGAEALVQQGKKQGLEQGLEQGEIQTKREVLLNLLKIRIGDIPDTVTKKVTRIRSRARLDSLLEQAATAEKLDDITWE